MSSPRPPVAPFVMSHRILVGALMAALVFIGMALLFVLPLDQAPPLWVPLAQLAAGAGIHLVLEAIGYRTPPLEPSLDDDAAAAQALVRYQSGMFLRFALCEAVAIASIALAFVLPTGGWVVYGVGAVVSLVLMVVHVWPWSRPVGKAADALEASGRSSRLREVFGIAGAGAGGAIQRL